MKEYKIHVILYYQWFNLRFCSITICPFWKKIFLIFLSKTIDKKGFYCYNNFTKVSQSYILQENG